MNLNLPRRALLRGMLGGAAIAVGVPFLDCFLNTNGTALASGAPLPTRFGTWFWGLGLDPNWEPKATGADFEFSREIKPLEAYRDYINLFSGYRVMTDARPNVVHVTGWAALRTGVAPASAAEPILAPTIDVLIGDAIGKMTRFRQLDAAATGEAGDTFSARDSATFNPPAVSPLELYRRVFGPGYIDPNSSSFTPDPRVMARQSVLSGIKEDRDSLMKDLGSSDKHRMEEYFTSLRQMEQQLSLMLQKPPPAEACSVVTEPEETKVSTDIDVVSKNHQIMAQLLAMAVACNQTNVFNLVYSASQSTLHKAGEGSTHHEYTHEEPVDQTLGYQRVTSTFVTRGMENMASFVKAFASIKEGDGTLLDHMLILGHSDTSYAKVHSVESMPMFTIGKAGGRIKSGFHLQGENGPVTRVGLTVMQAMGVRISNWGDGSMATTNPVGEILA